jgi:hypothetical protein
MNTYTESLVSKNVQMLDAYCLGGTNATVVLKSIGTDAINVGTGADACNVTGDVSGTTQTCGDLTISRTDGDAMNGHLDVYGTLPTGGIIRFTDGGCTTIDTARSCNYRFLVGSITSIPVTVTCSG